MTELHAHFIWTEKNVETVRRMWADRISASKIAAKIGAPTRNIVIGKIHRMGFARNPVKVALRHLPERPAPAPLPEPTVVAEQDTRRLPKVLKVDVFTAPEGAYLVTIDELSSRGDCRWPYGHRPPYLYCGKPATDCSYCCEHGKLAYASDARPTMKAYAPTKSGRGLAMQREARR